MIQRVEPERRELWLNPLCLKKGEEYDF